MIKIQVEDREDRREKKEERKEIYMTAKFHLPRSSFLSENRESSKVTRRKDMGMRGIRSKRAKGQDVGGEKNKERRSESRNLSGVSG